MEEDDDDNDYDDGDSNDLIELGCEEMNAF